MKGSRVLTIGIALVSMWAVAAVGNPAMWLTGEVQVVGLVIVPIVASLLVVLRLAGKAAASDSF